MIVGNAEYKLDHVDRNTGQLYSLLCLLAIIRHNLCNRLHLNHTIYIVHVQMHSYSTRERPVPEETGRPMWVDESLGMIVC